MNVPAISRVGGVLSADIAVPDHQRELRFYSRVLTTGEHPLWREDLMNNRGMPVIGLGEQSAEYADLPLQWMPHIQVADVAISVERASDRGGRELMHGRDDQGNSQWAVLLDPNGAAFGIIPVVALDAPPMDNELAEHAVNHQEGCIAWLDLTVPDAEALRDFYRDVVGWEVQDAPMKDAGDRYADYNMLAEDGRPAAGICHARGANMGLPPCWLIYLPVGDIQTSLRHVEEEGGQVIHSTKGNDGNYVSVVIQDPVGACLALVPSQHDGAV